MAVGQLSGATRWPARHLRTCGVCCHQGLRSDQEGGSRSQCLSSVCLLSFDPPHHDMHSRVVLASDQQTSLCVPARHSPSTACLLAMSCSKAARSSSFGTPQGSPRAGTPPTPGGGPARGSAEGPHPKPWFWIKPQLRGLGPLGPRWLCRDIG